MQILKYPLRGFAGVGSYQLPDGYRILSIEVQENNPVLYVEADVNMPTVSLLMYCLHTGDTVNFDTTHIGTVLLDDGKYVLHYFI